METETIPVSLVLGSGGARGLAHIGVIRALREQGRYEIRSITGSSIGALIGGLHAGGKLDVYTEWVRGMTMPDVWGLLDFSFTSKGLFEGDRLMHKLADLVGEARIEDLDIPFTAVASDIDRRQEVWMDQGSLFEAIRASIAIPGFFTPAERDGRPLVDGGLLSPLPLAPAQRHFAERTIAVSLNGNSGRGAQNAFDADEDEAVTERQHGNPFQQWYRAARGKLGLEAESAPTYNAFDTMTRSLAAMQDRIARYQIAAYRPDILIEIPAKACGLLDFHHADRMIELGYRKAVAALRRNEQGDAGADLHPRR